MTGMGSISSSGEEPFHLEKYRPACEVVKAQELDRVSSSPYASKSSQNEDTSQIQTHSSKTLSKKKHFLGAGVATGLGRSKDRTSREEQTELATPPSSSQERGYRRFSHQFVAKVKGLFNDGEVIPTTKEKMGLLSENPINTPQPLKMYEPLQQLELNLSRTSSLGSIIHHYNRSGVLEDFEDGSAAQLDTSNSNERNSLSMHRDSLLRQATIDSIMKRQNIRRDSELNKGGIRRTNNLEKAHFAPTLHQLHNQAVAAGYEDISDRMERDPEWRGSLGHWICDMRSDEGHSAHQQGNSRPSSLAGDCEEFKDFDGVFLSPDNTSSKRESMDSKEFSPFAIEDGADAPYRRCSPTIPRIPVTTRANSWDSDENISLPRMLHQEQFSAPQSQPARLNFASQQEIGRHNRGISEPGQTGEQANPTHSTHLLDWVCHRCDFLNLPRRTACLQCWEERAESLGDIGHRNRRVTFAKPTKFEGKHASAMRGYDASAVDASLIPEPLKIKSCLKAKAHREAEPADKSTQTGVQGSDEPASHQNQQTKATKATKATTTSSEAEQTADDIFEGKLKRMEAIVEKTFENCESMRRMLESMEKIWQHISEERNAQD
ncbi:hypothetical protein F4814DRAFT_427275 [Daldinia grandis]|nr:hypothetical protein F4814DRAFT_427275 [Daldinia grandis]